MTPKQVERAVTVGDDLLTTHKPLLAGGTLRPHCGAGKADEETTEWRRAVNCEACLQLLKEDDHA
ncbi:hypothetical protein [Streptomyces sp. MST-110588]|uniref:hypothetical protein n=1 Tax=Streptomyces sp. MST-110588 TaxID=2833628 RepID=UPI001F5DFEA1|nr:hypothetical protein [Streptomyces sp. MST-110588]UNO39288.1 hypothetical protein KGS77_06210 [Streptomyces sp. MST-110588]